MTELQGWVLIFLLGVFLIALVLRAADTGHL